MRFKQSEGKHMKSTRIILIISTLVLLLIGVLPPSLTVRACSGPPDLITLDESIEISDFIVHAKVKQVDSDGINGLLEVDGYLKGEGPQNILMVQTLPNVMAIFDNIENPGTC